MGKRRCNVKKKKIVKVEDTALESEEEDLETITTKQLVSHAMSIPLISKEIFKLLPVSDLLSCSLVNKVWHQMGREVLREHKRCVALISGNSPCKDIRNLNHLLETAENPPFNGIFIETESEDMDNHRCISHNKEAPAEIFNNILAKIYIKHLGVYWVDDIKCPVVELILRIFHQYSTRIEHLLLESLPYAIEHLGTVFGYKDGDRWLPSLKSLEVYTGDVRDSITKELISAAPRLQDLKGEIVNQNLDFLLKEGKSRIVRRFALVPESVTLDTVEKFVEQKPRLQTLTIAAGSHFHLDCSPQQLMPILKGLAESSVDTLEEFEGSYPMMVLYSSSCPPALPLTGILTLQFLRSQFFRVPKFYNSLCHLNLEKLFPNLHTIQLEAHFTSWDFSNIIQQYQESSEYSCSTVTTLNIENNKGDYDSSIIRIVSRMFPNVKHFSINVCYSLGTFCGHLWTAWSDIETIKFTSISETDVKKNLDTSFLGISKKEWTYLMERQKDLQFKDLHLPPMRSSILNCTKLRKFSIEISHEGYCKKNPDPDLVFLSTLTGHCVFSRMPGLKLEIIRQECSIRGIWCCFALEHLKPFATLLEEDPDEKPRC